MNKARLIFPEGMNPTQPGEVNWEGCEYSKCGRTDKGVSAFGQVVGIRVRSNRPLGKRRTQEGEETGPEGKYGGDAATLVGEENIYNTFPREGRVEVRSPPLSPSLLPLAPESQGESPPLNITDASASNSLSFDPIADEIPYPQVLNRLLPPDIRILAWCPNPPLDFSARFSCRERRYNYFFTQPAFLPIPHSLKHPDSSLNTIKDGWLDIEAMRNAAACFEGTHDFRNFCKVDAKKQIWNYERTIFYSGIEEVDDYTGSLGFLNQEDFMPSYRPGLDMKKDHPKVYTFTLHGSAFLWHQVRHMVAILFLIGQGSEKPELVSQLLDIEKTPCRPVYEMATDTPLVLWDCIFPHEDDAERKDAMEWHYIGQHPDVGDAKYGNGGAGAGLMDGLWRGWRERKVDELLMGQLIGIVAGQGMGGLLGGRDKKEGGRKKSQKVFDGREGPRAQGRYVKVMEKQKLESIEVLNVRYAKKMGYESSEAMKADGFRRLRKEGLGEVVDEGVE